MVQPFSLNIPTEIPVTKIENAVTLAKTVQLQVLRLDLLHPFVSGNKLYKLHYFLKQAIQSKINNVITFGGAYSNHLAATAFACNSLGLHSFGLVRGEEPQILSPTLLYCKSCGMQLIFLSREEYRLPISELNIKDLPLHYLLIPEGGYAPEGAAGAALIMDNETINSSTHIVTAVGTATTLAGLCSNASENYEVIGIPVLRNMQDITERISFLLPDKKYNQPTLFTDYHFGGYAKKTRELIDFMNLLFKEYQLPTDFVYTAKMMFGVLDKISSGYFPAGSIITALHTGGLQGNNSLPEGTLIF